MQRKRASWCFRGTNQFSRERKTYGNSTQQQLIEKTKKFRFSCYSNKTLFIYLAKNSLKSKYLLQISDLVLTILWGKLNGLDVVETKKTIKGQ